MDSSGSNTGHGSGFAVSRKVEWLVTIESLEATDLFYDLWPNRFNGVPEAVMDFSGDIGLMFGAGIDDVLPPIEDPLNCDGDWWERASGKSKGSDPIDF